MIVWIAVLATSLICSLFYVLWQKAQIESLKKHLDVGAKIASNIKLKDLMREVMVLVQNETKAEASSLYIVDEERQEIWFEVALGEKGDQLKEIRLKIGDGIAGWVAKTGEMINLKDVNDDPRFKKSISKKIEFKNKAMVAVPVKSKGKILGVIQVINKKGGGFFDKRDEGFIIQTAYQVAIALENSQLYEGVKESYLDTIHVLASAIDAKDPYTQGHSKRVTEYSLRMAKYMKFDDDKIEQLEYMAVLHDVGKIGIKDAILNKEAPLDNEEYGIMKTHVTIGAAMLEKVKTLREVAGGAKYHHERYDGRGYMAGLSGDEIPLEARMIAIADAYDAMTTDRPYRKGLSHEIAMEEIQKNSGTQFDPELVEVFKQVMKQ
ncbi:MAG: HD domain-containing protein [Tissierellales bacterium]|jgi:putative nucleotidyltransferase with HDIG domain|nr:HD domain-containing protein [Tissierellales bacterium]